MRVTDELLEDTVFDVEEYIAKEFALRLGMAEEEAFLDGDGNGKPLGLMRQLDRVVDSGNAGRITMEDMVELQHREETAPQSRRASAICCGRGS
mgnify:CR=1 FL=1